jgi:Ca-activated chloride channel homolog
MIVGIQIPKVFIYPLNSILKRLLITVVIATGTCLFTPAQNPENEKEEAVKVNTSLVTVPVIVSDRSNRYIPGLTQGDFRIFQDGSEQKIAIFSDQEAPMSVVLALDTSISTRAVIGEIKEAAKAFVRRLGSTDRCMILTFDFKIRRLSDLTSDRKALDSAVKKAEAGKTPGTVLNDALYSSVDQTLKNVEGRKAVIVLTDGKDYLSDNRTSEMINRLAESDTVIYPIYFETEVTSVSRTPRLFGRFGRFGRGRANRGLDQANQRARAFLQDIADRTGGRVFNPEAQKLSEAFGQIADEMKRQYLVGFYPSEEVKAGAVHKVKVKVDRPDTIVRAKAEYRTEDR